MEGTYEVCLGSMPMGTVHVSRQGLYWHFDCRCSLHSDTMQELILHIGQQTHNLGLLTPESGTFCLRTKLAAKKIGQGTPKFCLQPRHAPMEGIFVPLHPQEPFRYLHRLEQTYLARRGEEVGLVLPAEK